MLFLTIVRAAVAFCVALPCALGATVSQTELSGLLPPERSARSRLVPGIRKALTGNQAGAALSAAERLARSEPGNPEGPLWLGIVELCQGNAARAIRHLMRARQIEDSAAVDKALGVACYLARQHRLFEKLMLECIRKDPGDFAPYYFLGRFFDSDLNDFAKAGGYFEKAIERNPAHFRAYYYLGYTLEARGEAGRAEAEYRRALDIAARKGVVFPLPYLGLARLRAQSNRNEEALAYARRAVQLDPQDAAAHKVLGKILGALGRNAEAIGEWEMVVRLDPADSGTLYRLYHAYLETGQADRAKAALAKFKRIIAVYGTN
jgi:tetratricopeptide (TPR) repeat protein